MAGGTTASARSTSASVVAQPERQAQRAAGQLPGDAHGRQHVRTAPRAPLAQEDAAEAADLGLVEQEQQGLALDAREAEVTEPGGRAIGAGRRRRRRSRPGRGRRPGRRRPDGPGARRCGRRRSTRRSAVMRAAAAMATMPATFWVPLRRSRSWPPPIWRAASGHAGADDEGADALGAAELVGADRDQVGPGGGVGHVDPATGPGEGYADDPNSVFMTKVLA